MLIRRLSKSSATVGFLAIFQVVSSGSPQPPVITQTNTACEGGVGTQFPSIASISTALYQDPSVSCNTTLKARSASTMTIVLTSTLVKTEPTGDPKVSATGYMEIVNSWRTKMGMKSLGHEPVLEMNAMNTVTASKGAMIHKLNPGTLGQVLAPGDAGDFEHVFVGGWLCEIPSLPGLDDVCLDESNGWAYDGQTGHAEILTSKDYSRIGCAHFSGTWCCDLA